MVDFEMKDKYNVNDLVRIMEILRAPDGCMWDQAQDHHSIRQNFIEETYEVCEAIDDNDTDHLKEELAMCCFRSCSTRRWRRKRAFST